MPTAALTPCKVCKTVGCTTHKREPWQSTRLQPVKRKAGRWLQQERARLFIKHNYTCAVCNQVTVELVRDHVIPLAEGGPDIESNTQPLCIPCSDAKSEKEAQRGVRRWRGGA